ncbi:efflux RND transporter permease subunit [Anaeromyxobacter diazotrophicus]|uniref:Cation efflux system protein n=1 Tax=Anaeromyxobacter diazotrophicus TaxID=2590199 RepID=A0A7I9VQM3_9BACT|nr:CusA/CzcA family heavy metal efflux RND transporter [Anaeromyxobacter diazotrophicus]GEJ58723.1 cation efflux system protein [Anaeromyxobacter diazotrophicus]
MVKRIVAFALQNRALVVLLALVLLVGGLVAFEQLPVEAYPNPVPPMVEVIAQPPGWSAEEVERYVTIPLEIGLSGMPGLDHVRSQSLYALTDVKCYFKWGTRYEDARQEVINRLQFTQLPAGVQAQLSPWNAIGEVYRFNVRGKGYSLQELKTAADWILVRQFKQVPGVADVVTFGGETKEYHVEVDPNRLRARGVTLAQLTQALSSANQNVGGQRLTLGEQSYTIRGVGLIRSPRDIEDAVVLAQKGVPVRVRDVATVAVGHAPRLGLVGRDDDSDVVQGTVLMRYGGETKATLRGIYDRVEYVRRNHLLPPGMDIEPYYDRATLIRVTTRTVLENLLIGMVLVTLVLVAFLGSVRAALITALNVPLALLVAFIGMVATGTPANLISLGAVDFGIVVDSTVIMVENVFRHLGAHGFGGIFERVRSAAGEVGRPMAFSTLIIGVAFLPLFTMTGVSGVIFTPMAVTYAFAIGGALLLALTLTPVLVSRFVPAKAEEKDTVVMRALQRAYRPLFDVALRWPRLGLLAPVLVIGLCVALFPLLGSEYMPKLEEGNFWIRASLPMSVSMEQSSRLVGRMRAILKRKPEVVTVVSQLGRPDDGTDLAGFQNIELFAPLRPYGEWPRGVTKEQLTEELGKELEEEFPGVVFNFSQYLSDNVEEALSGVKGENSVKVKGPDIDGNEATAARLVDVMEHVRGVKDLGLFPTLGQPSIKIVPDRERCGRYGLNTGDVEAVVAAAVGGQAVTQVFEGEKSFALTVRWQEPYRSSLGAIRAIGVATPDGGQVPLGQLAQVSEESGPSVIYREDGSRYSPVKFSIRGRDLGSTVDEAQRQIADHVRLPAGAHLEWAGQINELNEAMGRLAVIIPLTLLLIALLVYAAVKTWLDTAVVLISIPVACLGGIVALLVAREPFSASAAMGFVSVFGIAIQDAILVVTYAQRQWENGKTLSDGARAAAEQQFRPGLMATLTATLGLLPAALSNAIGAQAQKPLAIVVIGGSLALAGLTRIVQPPLLVVAHQLGDRFRARRPGRRREEEDAAA